MVEFKRFSYSSLDELRSDISEMGLNLPATDDVSVLFKPLSIYGKEVQNRLVVQPMEGCDGEEDGSPSELVLRRYERFARGGCGLIWVEACAVTREARANPRQLWLHEGNVDAYKALVEKIHADAKAANGEGFRPFLALQLTHSGRYSKPGGSPAIYAAENPYLDPFLHKDGEPHKITDEELEALEDRFVEVARLAKEAGFDAVDVKACHRYLNNELLSARTREGKYGGDFEGRTRFLLNVIDKIKANVDIGITTRINAYDEMALPYGWCADEDDYHNYDLTEMKRLAKILYDKGIRLMNLTGGNPYFNPHVNRPYDQGYYTPPMHQLYGLTKLLTAAKEVRAELPEDMVIVSTGYSWLREYGANVAAGCIEGNWFDMAGFGRQSFAYPEFARDLKENGVMERRKCCIACGKCSEIMRNGSTSGCVIKDAKLYAPIYRKSMEGKPPFDGSRIAEHV
jgi:2,4-dienoyl-CoA reductase-like NADH-dependent reductase (Old Yellow Enzyme family)